MEVYRKPSRSKTLRAALAYAKRGIPVFPCEAGGKRPLTPRGHLDATTDPSRITAWWNSYPNANIGIPTGKRSGRFVLDVDLDAERGIDGHRALEALEAEHGELPATRTHTTGSGGMHYLYLYPDTGERFGNSPGSLPEGIHVRGEGGYIVAPPSATTRPYEVLDRLPLARPPEWLLEILRRPQGAHESGSSNVREITAAVTADLDGPEIPEGGRNWALYRIACSMRARGMDAGEILDGLHRVNANRCSPPVDTGELEKIARSATRHAPGDASPEVSTEVLDALDAVEADIMRRGWRGMGGKSERDAMVALVRLARMHGTTIPAGVRVSVDVRTLALMASVSKRALLDNRKKGERVPGIISRLKARGVIRSDNATRRGKEAGAMVLLTPAQTPRARLHHSTTQEASIEPRGACGATLRAPRLRWSRPVYDGPERVGTISRLGKSKGQIIDHLEHAGGTLTVEGLAEGMGVSRPRDLRRRHLEPLAEAGVVECSGDTVSLTADWLDALNERRDLDGEIADHRRDLAKYEREREAYRNRDKRPADKAPTEAEMRRHRVGYPGRRRAAIERAIAGLFAARPEYRGRRVGQIVCGLHDHLPENFPRGELGYPKDAEVEAVLDGELVA